MTEKKQLCVASFMGIPWDETEKSVQWTSLLTSTDTGNIGAYKQEL